MGLFDNIFNRDKKAALPNPDIIESQQEKIDAIVAKMKSVESEVKKTKKQIMDINENRNRCISTYSRFDPSKISTKNLNIRRLNKNSDYNYIVTLLCDLNNKDEVVLAQFNHGNPRNITSKFKEMIMFQENLQYGGIDDEIIEEYFKKLKEYTDLNGIIITKEGEEILTNTSNEPKNISKSVLYMGDDNTIEKTVIKDNEDILQDMDNYSFEEIPIMRKANNIVEDVVSLNRQKDIEEVIQSNQNILDRFLRNNPSMKRTITALHRKSIECDICLDAIRYLKSQIKDFTETEIYRYMELFSGGKEKEAQAYFRGQKLDMSKISVKIQKGDTSEEVQKKLQVNRFLHEKDKQNKGELSQEEEKYYDTFLDSIEPDPNYDIINEMRRKENMYLAGIIDREKTRLITDNQEEIKNFNDLLRRQDFNDRINYEISEDDDEQR